ncbi:MAG: LOG family protein [Planctomycetes bacterium]|nr:LOG family protein [Planctomycetota bacterium]
MANNDQYEAWDGLDDVFARIIDEAGGSPHSDIIADIMRTAVKLVGDGSSRGDLKIMRAALREMRYAFKVFRPYRGRRKVTIFGSARTTPDEPIYSQAREFAKKIADFGFMTITGAGPGLMQAAQEGAGRERSFGVNIRLPFEQNANPFIRDDPKLVNFKYFFTRKLIFVKESDAIVLFPGGFGTHDEGFESMTLVQTGKTDPKPLVFIDRPESHYWNEWNEYIREHLLERGLISEEDRSLYLVTDSNDAACEEILRFYRVYNSCRWVRGRLVLRLNHQISDEAVEELNEEFGDILLSGKIEKSAPLPAEANEPESLHLPRLGLEFNRRNFGRLRQLIDHINAAPIESELRTEAVRGDGEHPTAWFPADDD